jgi:alpha-tubulin suppressor-like RCC1 family protein
VLLENVRQVACRNNTSCAVTNDNVLYCWGYSWVGASLTIRYAAEKVADSVAQVSVGDGVHVCFVTTTGKVSCFGTNTFSQLGQKGPDSATPVDVPGFPDTTSDPPNSHPAVEVTVGDIHSCARLDSGTVKCWGGNLWGQLGVPGVLERGPTAVPNLKAKALAAGYGHTCAIGDDDVLRCWGDNESGQLGNGEACKESSAPVQVPTNDWSRTLHPKAIAAADNHTCLVNDDEHVWCWGMDGTGQTGHHDFHARQTKQPSRVSYFLGDVGVVRDARAITTGRWHSCALIKGGKLECWGRGDTGQLGDGGQEDSSLPVPPVF